MNAMLVLEKLLGFLKTHWKPILLVVGIIIAFFVGKYSTATKTVEVEKTVYKDRVVEKVVEVEKKVEVEGKTKVIYRTKVVTKEGETRIVEVEKEETKKETKTDTDTKTDKDSTKDVVIEKSKVVEQARPQWKVGALVGYDWKPVPSVDFGRGLSLGVHAERRIAGPVWIGVWGLHTGSAGVSVSVEF